MNLLSAGILLVIVVGLYLAASYLRNKNFSDEEGNTGCGAGCSGCSNRKGCGMYHEMQDKDYREKN